MAAIPRPGQRKHLKTSTPEQLASELATKLTISDPNAKLASMRAVNAASQTLSGIVQSGWKKSTTDAASKATSTSAISAATSAAKHLKQLCGLAPNEVDVERAAISVLGKLVVLEMFDLAEPALAQMHPRLCAILGASEPPSSYLRLPRATTAPTDPIILNIVATYLTYALVIQSHSQAPDAVTTIVENASLLEWLPVFSSLPAKSMDALLTRTYTALNKLCNKTRSAPQAVFTVRIYALRCLAHTSPGVIGANTFWDQAIKCGASLVKATPKKSEEEATKTVLSAYSELVQLAERRSDSATFVGVGEDCKSFVDFCEYWMSFAKRGGDIAALQRIDTLIKQPSSSTPPSPRVSPAPAQPQDINLEGTKICSSLNQLSLLLEDANKPDNNDSLLESIKLTTTLLSTSTAISILLEPVSKTTTEKISRQDAELRRMRGKVDRAFETCRRMALKRSESLASPANDRDGPSQIKAALHEFALQCVHCLEPLVSRPDLSGAATRDILTRCIDTLFVLSRDVLAVTSPTTFVPAFDHLAKAVSILNAVPPNKLLPQSAPAAFEDAVDVANYLRCVSGAFYNIAGSLYQATRYGNAVPFLVESCTLGAKALGMPRPPALASESGEAREKEWSQLEEQIGRRWELLGVCYSKNGDRKNAYDAFRRAIYAFPFASSGLTAAAGRIAPDALFGSEADASPAVKQLVILVDRVSYLGACDLMLPAEEVSLGSPLLPGGSQPDMGPHSDFAHLDPSITGALIERQLDSLEPSRWKDGVRTVFIRLLLDALRVYTTEAASTTTVMPVRRARVLVRCMEFAYRDHDERVCERFGFRSVEDIGAEVEQLLTTQSFGNDAALRHFIPQYRVAAHLWIALYTHRRADPEQFTLVSQRAEEASRLIRELLSSNADPSATVANKLAPAARGTALLKKAVKSPRAPRVVSSPKVARVTRQRTPAAPRKAAVPVRTRGKALAADPVTPKAKSWTALPDVMKTPPRVSLPQEQGIKSPLVFDKFENFMSLLQLSCRILGFLSLTVAKVGLLDMTRRLARRQMATKNDGYVVASLDLAHEYALLGKYKRAANIFNQALDIVRNGQVPEEVSVSFLLRYAELLALVEDVPKSSEVYLEALERSKQLDLESNASSTQQRIHARAKLLEITAAAAHVFGLIQFEHGDVSASLDGLLQALRLWNRSIDTLSRLNPPQPASAESAEADPFTMTSLKDALPSTVSGGSSQGDKVSSKALEKHAPMDGMEWRVSEGLLSTMLLLAQTYYLRGSAREALYFAKQAADLAESLNAPTLKGRAMAIQGEIQLHMGSLDEAQASVSKAAEIMCNIPGIDTANISRIAIELNSRQSSEAEVSFADAISMLDELDDSFRQLDNIAFGARRSLGLSPSTVSNPETLAPKLMVSLLSQQIWQMRDDVDDTFNILLEKLVSLAHSNNDKAEESILMARLTLHGVYDRLRTDLFLSSMTESTIAVPMGMCGRQDVRSSTLPSAEVVNALASAEKYLRTHLKITGGKGNVVEIREAATSLALICAFRTSLGDRRVNVASTMASLLDMSASLTLRHDMLEAAEHKLRSKQLPDDLVWPLLSTSGCSLPHTLPIPGLGPGPKYRAVSLSDSEDNSDEEREEASKVPIEDYWQDVRERYRLHKTDPSALSPSGTAGLPSNWVVININITDDKSTLFVSRQEGGEESKDPLIFGIPLKGRRDHGNEEDDKEQHLTFVDAVDELQDTVRCSNECTKSAVNIKPGDHEARSSWWKQRSQLDVRMRELLENIEYCWLGAFKAILNPQPIMSPQAILDFRAQFEAVFHRALRVKDKKPQRKGPVHKKNSSQSQTTLPSQFTLDDEILKCFSTLSPKCRDEELEDLVYFVLDLYQFHGVPIAIAEVDITQLVVDLRGVLEEETNKRTKQPIGLTDEHLFLVLDKNVQGLPWESIPILRGRSVSRIPGVQFLQDRLAYAKWKRGAAWKPSSSREGAVINPRNGYYILNPSGDLGRTEERFRGWAEGMTACGWDGIIGKQLTEQQFINALKSRDLVVYFGHGGGEQYVRSHMIRNLQTCAATMLWGCSSGLLRDNGDFDRTGTPYNYMLAGCPTLVANLWDVTDKDIDKFSQSVFDKLGLTGHEKGPKHSPFSLVSAVAQSRDSCKLKYLTGAAPVVYGIPFYL